MEVMSSEIMWVSLSDAEQQTGIPQRRLKELILSRDIKSEKDIRDRRLTLVDLNELNAKYPAKRQTLDNQEQ